MIGSSSSKRRPGHVCLLIGALLLIGPPAALARKPTLSLFVRVEGDYTHSTTQLAATWVDSPLPERAWYQYAISASAPTGPRLIGWTSVGNATHVTHGGLALQEGQTYYLTVRVVTRRGRRRWLRVLNAHTSDGIVVDTQPPSVGSFSINDHASVTSRRRVTLCLEASDRSGPLTAMQWANAGESFAPPIRYQPTIPLTLPAGEGRKTVMAKVQDAAGHWSVSVEASITLDTTPPTLTITDPPKDTRFGAH